MDNIVRIERLPPKWPMLTCLVGSESHRGLNYSCADTIAEACVSPCAAHANFSSKRWYRWAHESNVRVACLLDDSRLAFKQVGHLTEPVFYQEVNQGLAGKSRSIRHYWARRFFSPLAPVVDPRSNKEATASIRLANALRDDPEALVVWLNPLVVQFLRANDLMPLKDWLIDNDMPVDGWADYLWKNGYPELSRCITRRLIDAIRIPRTEE